MSAFGQLPLLLLAEMDQQLGREAIGIVKCRCDSEIILQTLEQFEAVCGDDDGGGFLFVALDGGPD